MDTPPDRLLTSSEVARLLGVSTATVISYGTASESRRGVVGVVLARLRPVALAGRGGRIKLFAVADVRAIAERLGRQWPADLAA